MSDKALPARPSLEQYRKQAKDLVKSRKSGDPAAIQRIKERHPRFGKLTDAEIDAVGTMYRGTTTLGLVATSVHPYLAGVQEALMELLLEWGASLEIAVAPDYTRGSVVNACLANGRPEAAEFLAKRGARLDLDGAAGVGWLDRVQSFFNSDESLKATATRKQMQDGFLWACWCGRAAVVDFLLGSG